MSNLYSTNVMDNEVVKAEDLTRGYDSTIDNVKMAVETLFTANKDFVIGGKLKARTGNDMSLSLEPVIGIGVNGEGEKLLVLETDEVLNIGSVENGWAVDRIDTVEIYAEETESNEQQRAFIDFDTSSKTLTNINVQKNYSLKLNIVKNTEGQAIATAPAHTSGRIKVAEIYVPANANSLNQCIIYPVTADVQNMDNNGWTNEKQATYNVGSIEENKEILRNAHNADGSHKVNCIGLTNLILNGANQITGSGLSSGGTITIMGEDKTSSIYETLNFIANKINLNYFSIAENKQAIESHTGDTDNPHGVTKAQVGLGSVDNKSLEQLTALLMPVGSIQAYGGKVAPDGFLLCNGQAVSRQTYAKLFEVIGIDFGGGDGITTFNVPDFTDKFPQGADLSKTNTNGNIGTVEVAGLPNSKGTFYGYTYSAGSTSGAMSSKVSSYSQLNGGSDYNHTYTQFNLSIANGETKADGSTYKASADRVFGKNNSKGEATVQPPAVRVNYIIKY